MQVQIYISKIWTEEAVISEIRFVPGIPTGIISDFNVYH
jgi:hypothetical protein